MILLLHPPVNKPGEAPAGLAKLAGALKHYAVPYRVIDTALEGLLYLIEGRNEAPAGADTWTRRASRHGSAHLETLRAWPVYSHPDRYRRAVSDLSRVVEKSANTDRFRIGLADYEDRHLSPARSADLIRAAQIPEENPFYPYFYDRLLPILREEKPEIIGLSLNYLSQALCAFAMIGVLRRAAPTARIVLGGGLVNSWQKRLQGRNPFTGVVDDMVAGPGEKPLLAMSGIIPDGTATEPDYSAFPLMDYLSPPVVLPYSASQGCYFRKCSFCPETAEENPYHSIPADLVMADLQTSAVQRMPSLIHFLDNALSPALLKALAQGNIGIPWYGFARITKLLADESFCRRLKDSGCVMLKLGLESGSQAVLDGLHKGIDLDTASVVLGNLKAAGIATYVYILFGTPVETPDNAGKTLDFVTRHGEDIDFLNVAVFNLPIDSADGLQTRAFSEGDLSLYYDFIHPQGWNRPQIRHFLDRQFKRHPVIAAILKRDPPVFTSNHAPFFAMANRA
ncbi:MAG: hypothetical protein CSYNP_03606 [Syntrophus sp. SKADARSKE-3]|nr:hypothetical protein [Syntrophus sp. SKADARSKE-3]